MAVPVGKGAFTWRLSQGGSPAKLVRRCHEAGMQWLAPCAGWQYVGRKRTLIYRHEVAHARALADAGIQLYPWFYPQRGKEREAGAVLEEMRIVYVGPGVILDPELPYLRQPDAAMLPLYLEVREALGPLPTIGTTSYGGGGMLAAMPVKVMVEHSDYGLNQAYDSDDELGLGYFRRSVEAWLAAGFDRLVPLGAAYGPLGARRMRRELSVLPVPHQALGVWALHQVVGRTRWPVWRDLVLPERWAAANDHLYPEWSA